MLEWIRFGLTAVLLIIGLFLMATGVIAQYRFKYVLNRMHAASMGDSLGLFLVVIAMCISAPDWVTVVKLLLVSLFIWITSPTGGHLIARLELTSNEHPENEMEVVEK
jgi:multicomponent Na+:H+ antiporter subunit G